jgi:MFS family permease
MAKSLVARKIAAMSQAAQASARPRLLWIMLASAALVLALNMGVRQTFGLFIEPMTGAIGMSVAGFSLAVAVQNLLWGLATPFAGMIADRFGTARVLVVGGLLYPAGLVIMALGNSAFAVHLGGGLVVGFAVAATGFPLVLSAVARSVAPGRRSAALGLVSAGGSAGQLVLLPMTQGLIGSLGWVAALMILAALSAFMVPLAIALAGKPETEAAGTTASLSHAMRQAGGHKGFRLLTAGFFVCGFHVAFVGTHLPGYIVASGLPALVGASALGLIGLFNVVGSLGFGALGSRYRKKYLLSAMYLARAGAIAFLLLAPKSELSVLIFSAMFGLLWLSTVPLTSALVGQIFGPRYMATLFGIVMMGHQLGAFFGAWLGGLSVDLTGGYDAVWLLAILLGILAALLHYPIPDRPVAAQPAPAQA